MNSLPQVRTVAVLLALAAVLFAIPAALAQVAGTNVNMVSGTQWPTGDPFLQRQNEPSMAVSTRNPMHIMAGANDYRSVDLETLLSGGTETGDSWLGIFKSFDGGLTWQSTLLPGCPETVPQCTDNNGHGGVALQGIYGAGSDPVVRAGTNGMFYYAGLAFVRPQSGAQPGTASSIFVARYNDLNNNENIDPIAYIDTRIIATGTTGNNGQFLDKPALVVDIPRAGANTCSFTVNQPGVTDKNGNPIPVHQSFAAGNVYVAYTDFLTASKSNSTPTNLMFAHSTDCGVTWSTPISISKAGLTSQGSAIAVNPVNGHVYVVWRQFASPGVTDAIMVAQSTNAGKSFSAPVQISTFQPFDQGTTDTSFRTNAYPSITTDMFGFVYVAFSARGLGPSGDARVVAAGSIDGTHWTPAIMVDNPGQNAQTNPSGRGHQIMPAITFANGRLTILYYDLRFDHYVNFYTPGNTFGTYISSLIAEGELAPPSPMPSEVFANYIDDHGLTMRRHTIDLRVLELGIFPTVTLGPSVSVSQYAYGCCVPPGTVQQSPTNIEQYKFNVPNLPLFSQGTEPFLGDYIEVVPSPLFVPSGNGWAYNFKPSVNPLFHATWTDNRDVVPPANGNWQDYTPPIIAGTTGPQQSIFEPGQTVLPCQIGQEGMRNQNIYTAQITGGLVVGAPGNAKPLGTTTFNGQTVPFQRAFAVEAQNVTSQQIFVRFTIANQPAGGIASFLQFSLLTTLDITIPPYSSVSRSVFVTSTNPEASITVNVVQISAIGGSVVTNGLSATAVLNPDGTNPVITNPNIGNPNIGNPNIGNTEVTDPNIGNTDVTTPNIGNPNIGNPDVNNPNIGNPNIGNPNIGNPNIGNVSATNVGVSNPNIGNPDTANPNIGNPNIGNPNIGNPNIGNPNIGNGAIEDDIYPMTNNGNTTASYNVQIAATATPPGGVAVQLILNKLYQTPVADNCNLGVETHWVTVANIVRPTLYTPGTPGFGTPNIGNPNPTEASVTLAPGETVYVTLRVQNTSSTPYNPVAALAPVTIPHAVDTQTVLSNPPGNPPPTPPVVYPQLTITTASLPATDQLDPGYAFQLQSMGGKPGTDTWSLVSSTPQGFAVSSSGLLTAPPLGLGPNSVTVQVQDGAVPPNITTKTLSISVNNIFLENVPGIINDGIVGQPYVAFAFSTTGGTSPITWQATGLPPGLSINPSTGQISGIPTVANPTGSTVHVTATDSALPPVVLPATISIRVGAVIVISPSALGGGTIGVPYSVQLSATGGIGTPFVFGPPSPAAGVLLSSGGLLSIQNPQLSSISFSVSVHDQANPNQFQGANYTILFAPPAVANMALAPQPGNSIGGQLLSGSPFQVTVTDSSNAAIANAPVTVSISPSFTPCATATLGGTLTQNTNASGIATFPDLTVDRGQINYRLDFVTGNTTVLLSAPFTVNGFCATGNSNTARTFPTSTLLNDGTVLIAGGQTSTGITSAAELYNPVSHIFTSANGALQLARTGHTATLLPDGTVLIVGGQVTPVPPSTDPYTGTAEIYNPGAGTFTILANGLNYPRAGHTATLLADGTVLIVGGQGQSGSGPLQVRPNAEIYNPAAHTFTAVGALNFPRQNHTATLLANGKVLIAAGIINAVLVPSAELYDPVAQTFANTGNLNAGRQYHTATLLSSGKVLVAGGLLTDGVTGIGSAELFDPAAGTFSFTGSLNTGRGFHSATLLPDGTVLMAGGYNDLPPFTHPILSSAEVYNPATSTFTFTGSLINARWEHTATLLNDGTVLIAGGFGSGFLASSELYYSTAPLSGMLITTSTSGQPGTTIFSNSTAFNGAATGIQVIGFNGILPAGAAFLPFNPLIVSGISFATSNAGTNVNVTTAAFYTPNNYPADFIIDSTNPGPNNQLTITLPQPTRALALDYGGFAGGASGSLTLSNGFVLPLSSLPAVGQTQFSGFVSATPFTSLTFNITNDSWTVLDVLLAAANVTLPNATEGSPYTQILLEQGGVGPLTWSQTSGSLPPGVNLSSSGILHGTPTAAGVYFFTVSVTDSSSPQKVAASGSVRLTVAPQPPTNASNGPVTASSAGIIWEFSLSPDVVGYNVYRSTHSGGPYTLLAPGLPSTAFSYTDSTVVHGTTYYYVVTAIGPGNVESVFSDEVLVNFP
jgi:hypothetical protein